MVSCLLLILTYPYIIAEFYAKLIRTDPYAGLDSGNVDALKHCRQPQSKRLRSCQSELPGQSKRPCRVSLLTSGPDANEQGVQGNPLSAPGQGTLATVVQNGE